MAILIMHSSLKLTLFCVIVDSLSRLIPFLG